MSKNIIMYKVFSLKMVTLQFLNLMNRLIIYVPWQVKCFVLQILSLGIV